MGNDTSLLLPGFRHWESSIPCSSPDWVWGCGIKMVHQKTRASRRTDIFGWGGREYLGDPDRIIGHIPLEHQRRLDCFGNRGSCGVCVARSFADRGTTASNRTLLHHWRRRPQDRRPNQTKAKSTGHSGKRWAQKPYGFLPELSGRYF